MARYYFDLYNSTGSFSDDEGLDLLNREAVRWEAIRVLPDIARDELPDGDAVNFEVRVRDESGKEIFRAILSLRAGWTD
jgi:hypothetical protein